MKRKLTKEEKRLTERGIEIRKKKLQDYKRESEYLEAFSAFNEEFKDYLEDKAKREKEQKIKLIEQTKKSLKELINVENNAINEMNKQLTEGVKIKKKPTGVG